MLEHVRRASIPRLAGAPDPHLEDTPPRRGRRSHGRLSFDANHLSIWSDISAVSPDARTLGGCCGATGDRLTCPVRNLARLCLGPTMRGSRRDWGRAVSARCSVFQKGRWKMHGRGATARDCGSAGGAGAVPCLGAAPTGSAEAVKHTFDR